MDSLLSVNEVAIGHKPCLTLEDLVERFIAAQKANWRNPEITSKGYRDWLGCFLRDHENLKASDFTIELFAAWKLSLRQRQFSPCSINHYLNAVRAMFRFAEDAEVLVSAPRLGRVKNERNFASSVKERSLYAPVQIQDLLGLARPQMKLMILLGLNCGFGPKDLHDLTWNHFAGDRVTLARSKTGITQSFVLWPETRAAFNALQASRAELICRMKKRGVDRSDRDRVFVTKSWRPWSKDAVAGEFRKLCRKAAVPCYGFYRLRHCASTAMAAVAMPHAHRKFLRHSRLQQQVTYSHTPDAEVDEAIQAARERLLIGDREESSNPVQDCPFLRS